MVASRGQNTLEVLGREELLSRYRRGGDAARARPLPEEGAALFAAWRAAGQAMPLKEPINLALTAACPH